MTGVVMVEAANEFIVDMLRRIQADVSELKLDVREIRRRPGHVETQVASLSSRTDRRDEQMDRVMCRPELAETSH